MFKFLAAAAIACAPLAAQVNDLGSSCSGTLTAPTLTGSIVAQDVTVTMDSPAAPYTPVSFGMFVIGFAAINAPLPCGCTLVPSSDVLEVGAFFTGTNSAQLGFTVPLGLTGTPLYFQGIEFFVPGSQTGFGCNFIGLDFNFTNAVEVLVP